MSPTKFTFRSLVAAGAAVLMLGACGSSTNDTSRSTTTTRTPPRPAVTIQARDFGFAMPATIPSGWVDVTLHDVGRQPHEIAFVKLAGMSYAAFKTAATAANMKAFPDTSAFVGGPTSVDAGKSVTATIHLEPGEYGVACFIPGHASKGMVAQVRVANTPASVSTPPIANAGTIQTSEFTFVVPPHFTGHGTVAFTNIGTQVHEAILVKAAPGKSLAEIKKYLFAPTPPPGPPAATDVGGVVGIGPHQTAYQTLALTPGTYVLTCFFPDPTKGGIPHAFEGMIKEFTVS